MGSQDINNLQEAYLKMYQVDEAEKWIQKAIKKPGALSKQLGVPEDENIPAEKLAAAAKKGGKLGKRARLAMTLKGLRREEIDLYDVVFTHLLEEGYAETEEAAAAIMVNMSEEWRESIMIAEGMTMKDFKQQRSRQKQKEKRAADKIAPGRRAGIHADKASPERAARHRANVDPDFEGNDERNYPGGKVNPKKVRKAKALGEM